MEKYLPKRSQMKADGSSIPSRPAMSILEERMRQAEIEEEYSKHHKEQWEMNAELGKKLITEVFLSYPNRKGDIPPVNATSQHKIVKYMTSIYPDTEPEVFYLGCGLIMNDIRELENNNRTEYREKEEGSPKPNLNTLTDVQKSIYFFMCEKMAEEIIAQNSEGKREFIFLEKTFLSECKRIGKKFKMTTECVYEQLSLVCDLANVEIKIKKAVKK
jgi:hypothetical protein